MNIEGLLECSLNDEKSKTVKALRLDVYTQEIDIAWFLNIYVPRHLGSRALALGKQHRPGASNRIIYMLFPILKVYARVY